MHVPHWKVEAFDMVSLVSIAASRCCVSMSHESTCGQRTTRSEIAGHVGVVGRGRGAAKSFTLECSHSPSAAERDEANPRHRNRVCCRLVPVSPTWTNQEQLKKRRVEQQKLPKIMTNFKDGFAPENYYFFGPWKMMGLEDKPFLLKNFEMVLFQHLDFKFRVDMFCFFGYIFVRENSCKSHFLPVGCLAPSLHQCCCGKATTTIGWCCWVPQKKQGNIVCGK